MPKVGKNRLTSGIPLGVANRASGLVVKGVVESPITKVEASGIDKIAPGLLDMVVDIDTLIPDPMNARLHPERNLESIKESLDTYGQVKPVVVNRRTMIVVAGNGTLAAAKELGWTVLAANYVDMTDAEAMGYGLADNRTAELAKWDFEVVARLDKLMSEADEGRRIGWTANEIKELRLGDWKKAEAAVSASSIIDLECPECGHIFPTKKADPGK